MLKCILMVPTKERYHLTKVVRLRFIPVTLPFIVSLRVVPTIGALQEIAKERIPTLLTSFLKILIAFPLHMKGEGFFILPLPHE